MASHSPQETIMSHSNASAVRQKPSGKHYSVERGAADHKFEEISKALMFCDASSFLQNFMSEDVRDQDLKLLSEKDLKVLIPQIGPRVRMMNWMIKYGKGFNLDGLRPQTTEYSENTNSRYINKKRKRNRRQSHDEYQVQDKGGMDFVLDDPFGFDSIETTNSRSRRRRGNMEDDEREDSINHIPPFFAPSI